MDNYFDGNYYYKIRKKTFWQIVVWVVIIMFGISLLSQIKPKGDNRGERIEIDYRHLNSKLSNVDECCLCGNNARSLMGYYRKFDTIGILLTCGLKIMTAKAMNLRPTMVQACGI